MITTFLVEHRWVTTMALVACLAAGAPLGYALADRRRWAFGLGLASLLPVAALTLLPTSRQLAASCAVEWSLPPFGAVELMANIVLLIPPTLLLGVATRRPLVVLAAASGLSALIEITQALVPELGRSCSTNDWLMNSIGAALGVSLAALGLWGHALRARGGDRADAS